MKITKITKILPIALALSLSIGAVSADVVQQDEQKTSGDVVYTLTLADYVRITNESSVTTASGKYDKEYEGMKLEGGTLTANFQVITNDPRTVTLSGKSFATDSPSGLYGYDPDTHEFYLVFVNTSVGGVDATSVTNITSKAPGQSNRADSPNAFAVMFEKTKVSTTHNLSDTAETYEITGVQGANTGDGASGSSGDITFTIQNGVSTLNFTANTTILTDTFNTRDREGTYQAQLVLTNGAVL